MLARFDPGGTLDDLITLVFDTLWEILSQTLPSLQSFFLMDVN